jgi:hypothetical protein
VNSAGVLASDTYSLILPAGPPTPGITTVADPVQLPAALPTAPETATLTVRLVNSSAAAGSGAVELVTPAGVEVADVPPICVSHRQLAPNRHRCEISRVDGGNQAALLFALRISASVRADAPLVGVVFGTLSPPGQEPLTTLSSYAVVVDPPTAAVPASSISSPSPTVEQSAGVPDAAPDRHVATHSDGVLSKPLNAVSIIGSLVGLVTLAGVVGVLSLRRRLRDDI